MFENSEDDDLGAGMDIQAIDEIFEKEIKGSNKKNRPNLNERVCKEFELQSGASVVPISKM